MAEQGLMRTRLSPAETAAIRIVLDGLPSEHSRRAYERALIDFFHWHRGVGHPQLSIALPRKGESPAGRQRREEVLKLDLSCH